MKYTEYKNLNLIELSKNIKKYWSDENIFKKSIENRNNQPPFIFYEGPPSANGLPGIHHVMGRTIKDIFCRYKTQKGFKVERKAGWDTHGLPVELGVEKSLGITKEDIGTAKISVEEYNEACRTDVMKYTGVWNTLTKDMGYWVDTENPYTTYDNKYIESVWWLLKNLYNKKLIYKGYTIQPYSPAAGTGLSSHELNQPGCYKMVKDTSVVAQFKILNTENEYFLAWTTTPWTLPSNVALAVGRNIIYQKIETFNPYTGIIQKVILAKNLVSKFFNESDLNKSFDNFKLGDKSSLPYRILVDEIKGSDLIGMEYEQLLPYSVTNSSNDFKIVLGDFVTTENGTGIVHIAPSFGADDFRVGKQNNLTVLTLVDKTGKFTKEVSDFSGEFVKEAFLNPDEKEVERIKQNRDKYLSVDDRIVIKLKKENKAFKSEKYEHSYPHCWRTDKPILYYPLDSWFVKTTAVKDRMIELNNTINWKPESTGTGRFGNWLENLQDWNLSRSRFWGIPLPIWRTKDQEEEIIIGSVEELRNEILNSIGAGFMVLNPLEKFIPNNNTEHNYSLFDLHKPYVDDIVLISPSGKPMYRESDLIDVWFDSGAMPYAQLHYPFENKELIDDKKYFPADFIAEGVDQTRGWFFTLHAISTMIFDSVAYKNVLSNGLVLDKNGNKMAKRMGNAVDPFEVIGKYGPDATRWYMITNASPWDNLKFNTDGIEEVSRKLFSTLHNTYNFFATYANIDEFKYEANEDVIDRPELDRWILSSLNSLVKKVDESYSEYDPTKAGRYIEQFVDENLSNWYVRLSRRRFWKSDKDSSDKLSGYQTLYICLDTLSKLMAPIAPFYAEHLYRDLNGENSSVHLSDFPKYDEELDDVLLEERMKIAQDISSMVLSLRKKSNIRVRQPLQKIMIPIMEDYMRFNIEYVGDLIKSEVNVKEIVFIINDYDVLSKKAKPNFKKLGAKYPKHMKFIKDEVCGWNSKEISILEVNGYRLTNYTDDGSVLTIRLEDVELTTENIPGLLTLTQGNLTVALDVTITDELKREGLARELINRIQNTRKSMEFSITDRILVTLENNAEINDSLLYFKDYICLEVLADDILLFDSVSGGVEIEIDHIKVNVKLYRL
jgi:isoleucyl-tRNA synthetase